MKSIKNILVTTDFSRDSELAVEEAAYLARKFHSTLYMLNTVTEIVDCSGDYCIPYYIISGEKNRLMSEAKSKIMKIVADTESRYQIKAIADIRYGNAYDEIMKEEVEKDIDLVVIAPHARKKFAGRLFSHLSDRVARNSRCDTLIIRQ